MKLIWLAFAILSYFLFALVALIDKYVIKGGYIPSSKVYAFYVCISSVFALFLIPFVSFSIPSLPIIGLSFLAGAVSVFSLLAFYSGLQYFEASRFVPAFGGFLPLFTFAFSYYLSPERFLGKTEIVSFILLVLGSVLISLGQKTKTTHGLLRMALITAFLFSAYLVLAKLIFLNLPFWPGFIWMRVGAIFIIPVFFIFKDVRKQIFGKRAATGIKKKTLIIFFTSQGLGSLAVVAQSFAVALVPLGFLSLINALQGIEYIFILLMATFLSHNFPQFGREKTDGETFFQKILAIILIGAGVAILAFT